MRWALQGAFAVVFLLLVRIAHVNQFELCWRFSVLAAAKVDELLGSPDSTDYFLFFIPDRGKTAEGLLFSWLPNLVVSTQRHFSQIAKSYFLEMFFAPSCCTSNILFQIVFFFFEQEMFFL